MVLDIYVALISAPCRAVLMTAKHLGISYNVKEVNLREGEQLKPDFVKMNPQHCVPTIDDNGFYMWESRAAQTYLANKYGPSSNLYPNDPQKRAVVDRMLYFDIGTLYKAEAEYVYPQLFQGQAADPAKEENFKKALGFLENYLSKTAYVAGDNLTLADQSILASLTFIEILLDYSFSSYPKISAWLQKLKTELPYYKEINETPLMGFKAAMSAK